LTKNERRNSSPETLYPQIIGSSPETLYPQIIGFRRKCDKYHGEVNGFAEAKNSRRYQETLMTINDL
jgi:hypothetical protein